MPAESEGQKRMMCADLRRKREGKKTRTGMSERQLEEFCSGSEKVKKKKGRK